MDRSKRGRFRLVVVASATMLALAGCGTSPGGSSTGTVAPSRTVPAPTATPALATPTPAASPSASRPCGTSASPPAYQHVVWILMENRGFGDVVGSASAPYLASLARACGLAGHYAGVAHPSLPNYIALTSGSTNGIGDDSDPSAHPIAGPSIFSLLGAGWRSLEESMPADCDRNGSGEYAVKHNPAAYYTNIIAACAAQDVPLGSTPDLSTPFTLIIPNLCHDMHDCSTATGDTWLAGEMRLILDSAIYRSGDTAVFVTWDENESGGTLVPTYVVAPSVRPGTRAATPYTHYSLLRTTEDLLHLRPLLGSAVSATSLRAAFNL